MEESIQEFIAGIIEPGDEVQGNTPLYSSGLLSSMNHLQLINFIERTFDISIPMNEISLVNFDTIQSIAGFIRTKQTDAGGNG